MADIITNQSDSLTIYLVFSNGYDPSRIQDISVSMGMTEIGRLTSGGITAVANMPRQFRIALSSENMRCFQGKYPLEIAIDDATLGVKRSPKLTIQVNQSQNRFSNASVNSNVDATINITIAELGVTTNVTLANIHRGYSAYEIAVQNGFVGTEQQWITAVESNRTLAQAAAATATTKAGEASTSAAAAATSLAATQNIATGNFKGAWNASTNSPTLTTTPSAVNDYYEVSVAGTQSITGSSTAFVVGDKVRSNGTAWVRVPFAISDASLALEKFDSRLSPVFASNFAFSGTASVTLPATYTLNSLGDYIEWEGFLGPNQTEGIGLFGKAGSGFSHKVGFYSATQVSIRQASGSYITWAVTGGTKENRVYKVEVVAGGWQLSVNGVAVSTQTKSAAIEINNVGTSYATGFVGKLKRFTISTAGGSFTSGNLATMLGASGVTQAIELARTDSQLAATLPNVYVSYNPTGSVTGHALFMVYVKYAPNSLFYAGYQVARIIDNAIRADLTRIYRADLYKYVEGAMIAQNIELMTEGDSECAYQAISKTDATGGAHGDEKLSTVYYYTDGIRLTSGTLSAAFGLTPCSVFSYEMVSSLYETDNLTDVIQAAHKKITTFNDSGYTTENTLVFSATPPNIYTWYSGIVCVAISQSGVFYTEELNYGATNGSNTPKLNEVGPKSIRFYNANTNLGCFVTSEITKAKAGATDNTKSYNEETIISTFEAAGVRTKYYRELRSKTPASGEIWSSKTTVKHFKK